MKSAVLFASTPREKSYHCSKNYGIYRVAHEIRNLNIQTQVVQFFNRFSYDEIDKILINYVNQDTLVVGFGTIFWDAYSKKERQSTLEKFEYICEQVKIKYPHIQIIIGGPGVAAVLNDTYAEHVDAYFKGLSEQDIPNYMIALRDGLPIPKPASYTKNIPTYNSMHGEFDFTRSFTTYEHNDFLTPYDVPILEVARGCIFKCAFCAYMLNGKKKFDYIKDKEVLKKELIENYENHGVTNYILSDDTLNDSDYKINLLHETFTSLPFELTFSAYLRLDLLHSHKNQIPLLKEMGLIGAYFGVETFNKNAGKIIGKSLGEKQKDFIAELKDVHWGKRVKMAVGLITGLPNEDYESHEKAMDWISDKNNNVDRVTANALVISDPSRSYNPWQSDFQKKSKDYGYNWPTENIYDWRNSKGPVKSFEEAQVIQKQYQERINDTVRVKLGGFALSRDYSWLGSQKNGKSINELIDMDRFEYTKYVKQAENDTTIEQDYIDTYKQKVLTYRFKNETKTSRNRHHISQL